MIQPATEEAMADAIRTAAGPLAVRGGGTRAPAPDRGDVLSTAALSGVTLYEPGALTIVALAGTPVSEIEAALSSEGQRLAFEPMDHRMMLGTANAPADGGTGSPTLGGVVAGNVSGPRRIQAGACRDFWLGVRFVDGSGTVIRNGGRVMKNVTGYDLVKMVAGSHGTLGVLTEVSLKVLPAPESVASLTIHGLGVSEAVRRLGLALASPFEVTGAAHLPGKDGAGRTILRLEGFAESVKYRAGRLQTLLAAAGPEEMTVETEREAVGDMWRKVRDVEAFSGHSGDVWRISVKPTDGPKVADVLTTADLQFDWGGGLVWALVAPGTDLRGKLGGIAGHATLVRASDQARRRFGVFHPEPGPVAALSDGLRRRFDPRGVLNPGLMSAPEAETA